MKGRQRKKFRNEEENCAILGHYAASSGNFLPAFRDNQERSSQLLCVVRPKTFITRIFENFTLYKMSV